MSDALVEKIIRNNPVLSTGQLSFINYYGKVADAWVSEIIADTENLTEIEKQEIMSHIRPIGLREIMKPLPEDVERNKKALRNLLEKFDEIEARKKAKQHEEDDVED